jgi:hypothetical protein
MAEEEEVTAAVERTLEITPTWAVATVCFFLILISILIEQLLHLIGKVLLLLLYINISIPWKHFFSCRHNYLSLNTVFF